MITQSSQAAPTIAPQRAAKRVPGEPGVWVFILVEMAIFTTLFGVIVWSRAGNSRIFAAGQAVLSPQLGLFNTIVLIAGSVLVVNAITAVDTGQLQQASRSLTAAMACGGIFAAVKAVEYHNALHHGLFIHTNAYWMFFFVVTGAHLLHVFVGVSVLGLIRGRVRCGLPGPRDRQLFMSATCYWHMVDLLWLVLFPLFYLVN
jgi:nitric oxide reductase NorE protein